jgi:hypothetical protein
MTNERNMWLKYMAWAMVGVGIGIVLFDSLLGVFLLPAFIGAAGIAGLLAVLHARPRPAGYTSDSFRDVAPTDVINVSHIRVAGVGGLGLVVICALIAAEFKQVAATLAAGLGGGIPLAVYLVRRRRHEREHDAAVNGPGGRAVFH